jgi:hypothetical protein
MRDDGAYRQHILQSSDDPSEAAKLLEPMHSKN